MGQPESLAKAKDVLDLIRDELVGLKKYKGVTGEIIFDASWNDIGRIFMAEIRDGDFVFSPAVWKYE